MTDPDFAVDLYRGTARDYDRFRLAYPAAMVDDLLTRVCPPGDGVLVDLACGTGQLAFGLLPSFAEVWAVDQEPDMVSVVAAKARTAGPGRVNPVVSRAEDLDLPGGTVDLVTIGNAFHRLRRDPVARRVHGWLRPGGHLALCWSTSPWVGDLPWQRALSEVIARWRTRLDLHDRVPEGWDRDRRDHPDAELLSASGFELTGRHEFPTEHRWTVPDLAGHLHSTSFLSRPAVGPHAAALEADLAAHLTPHAEGGTLVETVAFAYDLFRRP